MKTFQDYNQIYDGDRYCLMCRHVCPVTRMTKREATSPHGWALLVASVQRGMLKWDDDTIDTLYQCANCGTCQAHCATDRALPAAIVAARAEVVRQGLTPESVCEVDRKLREWGNPYGKYQTGQVPVDGRQSALGLFVGDAAPFLRPQAIDATVKLLAAADRAPTLMGVGRSSGYLPYALGLWDTASELALETIAEIKAGVMTEIVTMTVQDAFALRDVYAELDLSLLRLVKITDLVEFLAARAAEGRFEFRPLDLGKVAYYDPTHVTRFPQRAAAARQLAKKAFGQTPRNLFWREIRTTPSGASGGLEFIQPRLAHQLAQACIADAREAGADVLLIDDPLCVAQLEPQANGLAVKNMIELLAEQLETA